MSQDWLTAQELAGLPGMPGTHSAVLRRAKAEAWESRQRAGRGGGREYAFEALPVETQAALLKASTPKAAPTPSRPAASRGPVDRESLWESFERRPQGIKDEAARRLQALLAVERLVEKGTGRSRAVDEIAKAFGESRATLYRWAKAVKGCDQSDWLAALVPGYVGRTSKAEFDPAAQEFFKAQFLREEAPSVSTCYQWMLEAAAEHGWSIPSQRTVTRWANEIPAVVRTLKRQGEHAVMAMYPSQRRTVADLHAMNWINGDGYQHNVFVKFPDGTIGRPKTWFWQDIYSRRFVGHRTDRTEHSDMIRLALGDVIEKHGIPEHVTIDNTRAAANKWLTAGVKTRYRFKIKEEDPIGLIPQMGMKLHWTSVHKGKGHGQAKPVERAFGVGGLGEYVDKHPRFAGAYTGPNVLAKPENYASTAIEFDVFVQVLRACIDAWNAREGRRTEICAGELSFDTAFRESYERNAHLIRRATEAQRRMWMLTAESVRVQRDATVALTLGAGPNGRNRYACDALIEHVGRQVVVRFDPDSLHESVHLYQPDGRYIGEAECQLAAGFGDTSAGREWRRQNTQRLKAAKQAAAAELRMSAIEAAEYMPVPDPDPEEAQPKTNVVRGAWTQKRVAGSDVVPDRNEDVADKYNFDDLMQRNFQTWRKEQV